MGLCRKGGYSLLGQSRVHVFTHENKHSERGCLKSRHIQAGL